MNLGRCLPILFLAASIGPVHAAELRLHAVLNGGNVVSATDSEATGEATAVLQDDGKVRINLVFGGLASDVTGASLHTGTSAENGPPALPLDVRKNQTAGSLVDGELDLSEAVAQRMRDGETYLLVTTIDHPAGAIRGQLVPQPVRLGDQPEEEEGD
ncbi:MAG: CHRD domain-containing protein [Luteimonas sp.]